MLKQRFDIPTNRCDQSTSRFEGYRHILLKGISAPDSFKTSQIMQGDIGHPAS